jgi:FAD/FMN-containing dehydrogenase/Fe-S oxidoreductase
MIPYLDPRAQLPAAYRELLDELARRGFSGEIRTDYASRLSTATDSSVYQLVPVAVLFPRSEDDVAMVLRIAREPRFASVEISPRGGGTGSNGQSLCGGVVVDVSRHFTAILETNLAEKWVRVQPGVILDQLNAHLAPHGVLFAPNVAPSSRVTIGGMVSTDAAGKGSRVYGKTSDHVLGLRAVLMDGSVLEARPLEPAELEHEKRRDDMTGGIFRTVDEIVTMHAERIAALPKLSRYVTGYDLAHVRRADGSFDLSTLLCGSEGTLAIVTEAKLRLTNLPAHRALVAIRYGDFDAALQSAAMLVRNNPSAIETIDDTILELARRDVIWTTVAHLVEEAEGAPHTGGMNLVEFEGADRDGVAHSVEELCRELDTSRGTRAFNGYTVVYDPGDIAALWALRKKGVGLVGNFPGDRRPVPFVEDTAVPPERLAEYIRELRGLLDGFGLRYSMFGHVDVGCLHVRPALDLCDPADATLLRTISDRVVELVRRFGGVLWGEHGKGFRSEYAPRFVGPVLYAQMRRVKEAFDPRNQLNPGKIATPLASTEPLASLDAATRGEYDRQIPKPVRRQFEQAMVCNGNGACFDWTPDSLMCPSWKVTQDRIHSPKGRAAVMREWLRLLAVAGHDPRETPDGAGRHRRASSPGDFSHEVYDAMAGCFGCKACATHCPTSVDIPALRSEFLARYHQRYRRPLRDYLLAAHEKTLMWMGRFPLLADVADRVGRRAGIVDMPRLAKPSLASGLRQRDAPEFVAERLARLGEEERARTVLVAQDAFTTFYEPRVALAAYDVLTKLGLRVVFLPYHENGKALHLRGFAHRFASVARKTAAKLAAAAELGIPIVGIEPAVTLTYRDEYAGALGNGAPNVRVLLLQEFLSHRLSAVARARAARHAHFRLFGHCTERTAASASQRQWQQVFVAAGADLDVMPVACCGMCGMFGHEAEHREMSRAMFAMSWEKALAAGAAAREADLVTGHSCRSQVKRFAGFQTRHPVEALRDLLCGAATAERNSA